MSSTFWNDMTCYNCGIQYRSPKFLDECTELAGECPACYSQRTEQEEKLKSEALNRPPTIYSYFVTITKKPDVKKEDLLDNLAKLVDRPALRIAHLEYVLEHWKDDSNPHIHVYMQTYRRFDKSRIRSYTKSGQWNIQKAKGNKHEIREYMGKENDYKILIDNNA